MGNVESIVNKIKQKKEKKQLKEEVKEEVVNEEDEEYYEDDEDVSTETEQVKEESVPEERTQFKVPPKELTSQDEIMLLRDSGIFRQALLLELKQLNSSIIVLNGLIDKAMNNDEENDGEE